MGNVQGSNWKNINAKNNLLFLRSLFGMPYEYTEKNPNGNVNGGAGYAKWLTSKMSYGKTLFGKPICLRGVALYDLPDKMLYVYVDLPNVFEDTAFLKLTQYFKNFGISYSHPTSVVQVVGNSLDYDIVVLSIYVELLTKRSQEKLVDNGYVTSYVNQQLNGMYKINNGKKVVSVDIVKRFYYALCDNINKIKKETFADDPWYAVTDPYSSNQPLDISLVEQDDAAYYKTFDNYMNTKRCSKNPNAFPRAPSGKATEENFYNLPELKKKEELISVFNFRPVIQKPKQPKRSPYDTIGVMTPVPGSSEHMIPYSAYAKDLKPGSSIFQNPKAVYQNQSYKIMENMTEKPDDIKKKIY